MARLVSGALWLVGAVLTATGAWSAVVYLFDQFDRGYGRTTWFQLQLYVSALAIAVGLAGFVVAGFIRPRSGHPLAALLAGVVFSFGDLLLLYALVRAFPDRDMLVQRLGAALVIGAITVFVTWPRST